MVAKNLGDGHRIFYGVVGSGKTIILIARARYLAKVHPKWRILVIMFNKNLTGWIRALINPQDCATEVTVMHFHSWARNLIISYPQYQLLYNQAQDREQNDLNHFFQHTVPALLAMCVNEMNPP